MLTLMVKLSVKPEKVDEFLPLLEANGRAAVRDEPGCYRFDISRGKDNPSDIYLYEVYADEADPSVLEPMVDVLSDLAGDGAVLEFAVGTGRVALPLARRASSVQGIELSPHMAERLRAKPGSEAVTVTVGDRRPTSGVDGQRQGRGSWPASSAVV